MPVVVQKRPSLGIREKALVLLLILLALIAALLALKQATTPAAAVDEQNNEMRPHLLLQEALACMTASHALLEVEIRERGEGYTLNFKGKKLGASTLSGKLVDYDLEIFRNRYGELYVKDLVTGAWLEAAELELDALREFFILPFDMLLLYREPLTEAVFVSGGYEHEQVIKLRLPPEIYIPSLGRLTQEDERLECYFFIEADRLFINRISLLLHAGGAGKEIFTRTYLFTEPGIVYQSDWLHENAGYVRLPGGIPSCVSGHA